MIEKPNKHQVSQQADDERVAYTSLRSIVAAVLFAAGMFCLVLAIPAMLLNIWIDPPPGGPPAEALRVLIGLFVAGILWLGAAFAWTRAPWYIAALVTAAGWAMMLTLMGDR